jgi:hypothetical protein
MVSQDTIDNTWNGEATWYGGGPSEALMETVGGEFDGALYFWPGSLSMPQSNMYQNSNGFGYGNNSPADYFAHTFAATVLYPGNVNTPKLAEMWMNSYIYLTQ